VLSQATSWGSSGRIRCRHGRDRAENDGANLDSKQFSYSHTVRQLLFRTKGVQ